MCLEAAAGAFFVAESKSRGPSLSFVAVLAIFLVAVFFTSAGGSLGFIAAVLVVRVVVAGAGSVGVAVFERVVLVVIIPVDGAGFGKREEAILYLALSFSGRVSIATRRAPGHVLFFLTNAPPLVSRALNTS